MTGRWEARARETADAALLEYLDACQASDEDKPLAFSDLAAGLHWPLGRVYEVIDRLEKEWLVRLVRTEGGDSLVHITWAGRRRVGD